MRVGWLICLSCIAFFPFIEGNDDVYTSHSFQSPFDSFGDNKRIVSKKWRSGGETSIKEHFIRLTPDRQSKQGWLFNDDPIEFEDFEILLKFRISGQGKSLYGDGMGFWVTQKPDDRFVGGPLLGSTDEFYGFGILFDTFRNVEAGHIHKDISLVQSDGATVDLSRKREGCSAQYRYWEGMDSFNADMHSAAKILLKDNTLTVEVDKRASGQWIKCFSVNLSETANYPMLNPGWIRDNHVHFGMSASTGALADNHDIIEFLVTKPDMLETTVRNREEEESRLSVSVDLEAAGDQEQLVRSVVQLAHDTKELQNQLKKLKKDLEHKLESLGGSLRATISKLKAEEDKSEARIDVLEAKSKAIVEDSMRDRLADVERKLTGGVEMRLENLEKRVNAKVESVEFQGGGWKWPFVFFAILVAGALAYNFRSIRRINKIDKFV
eukprot:CAMPEP_0184021024 /NCGR_PEP_ID=MMETSP0954-20121128/9682_1 /TAXON_ID=627963 /ORGANISM="Aplanochytrium sp, Strain PBS07" /LENGTH=437 /DNA_ID=CAMNT_0026302965 /DNA_START=278 /DNA_END=1591 /DNA_ORIENTATION=-